MLIKKMLLAAAAVMSLAVPAAAMAQGYGGYHDGGRYSQAYEGQSYSGGYDGQRYAQPRDYGWRRIEREPEMRQQMWGARSQHHRNWQSDNGSYRYQSHADGYRSY